MFELIPTFASLVRFTIQSREYREQTVNSGAIKLVHEGVKWGVIG